ncbi:MAG: hypothetical protein JSS51_14715 [Planctomycetes bacterium]|nr:hypothetical protein [Planctomycetota bacterium]
MSDCVVQKLEVSVKFWRRSAVTMGAAATVLALGAWNADPKKVIGVSGGDNYIYRVYDDGSIDFIQADNQVRSARGIPSWQPIPIDPSLPRQNR